jgi:hypothetical protein
LRQCHAPLGGVASFWREAILSRMMVRTIIKSKIELREDKIKNTHYFHPIIFFIKTNMNTLFGNKVLLTIFELKT